MRLTRVTFLGLSLLYYLVSCNVSTVNQDWVDSPEGNIRFLLLNDSLGKNIKYEIHLLNEGAQQPIIHKSVIGIEMNQPYFSGPLTLQSASPVKSLREKYTPVTGRQSEIDIEFNEILFSFKDSIGHQLNLRVRIFNNGVAFRYEMDLEPGKEFLVSNEFTSFNVGEAFGWLQPYDEVTKWTPGYEKPYFNKIPSGTNLPNKEGWCFPMLFQKDSVWILITESGLDGTYPATHIDPECNMGEYRIRFPEVEEAMGIGSNLPFIEGDWKSPWRVITITKNLNELVNSHLVNGLSPPTKLDDISWVKPGIASWSWWSDHDSPKNPIALRNFIDLAYEMGWPYSLIDANWNELPLDTLKGIIQYAEDRDVGLWLWFNSGGPHNQVEEAPRDLMHDSVKRDSTFQAISDLGIKGVKIDFFQSDKQFIIKNYIEILEDAAKHKILLNFHGCTMPKGWERTYPHLLTMEAVRGAETYSFNSNWPEEAPVQNTIYPFTRNLTGSMDYTPVTFSHHEHPRQTTLGHELALAIVFESALQHFSDKPEAYLNLDQDIIQILKRLPVTWDEARLIHGYPGKDVVLARKKGRVWYFGIINGEGKDKKISIDLAFAGEPRNVSMVTDSEGKLKYETISSNPSKIDIKLKPFGGALMIAEQ